MGDYSNIGLPHHTTTETKEKYCKYSYSYCAICDKQSPRRRSKSETNECCKRKCREMKSLTPKKYDKCIEYENMEMEFDSKGWHETKYDCCRIRSNLVELPTSYIANTDNCQVPSNLSVLQDGIDCLKSFKQNDFCPASNSFDLRAPFEHVRAMDPRTKLLENVKNVNNIEANSLEPSMLSYIKSNGYHAPKPRIIDGLEFDSSHGYSMGSRLNTSSCREYCQMVDFKSQDADCQAPLCYNTETYFNRQIDRENYSKEVDYLREKLKFLHNCSYTLRSNQDSNVQNLDSGKKNILRESCITTTAEAKHKLEEKVLPSEGAKYSNCKISLKTRKINIGKTQRGKARLENIIIINSSISGSMKWKPDGCLLVEYHSDESESDSVEDDVAEEDSQSISSSDPISTDESSKDSSSSRVSVNVDSLALECTSWPVRSSLFPNIPPYVKFRPHDLETVYKFPNGKKYFKWKLSTITPIIVRKTLSNSGFALVRKSNQWLGTWGKHMKSPMFKTLKDTQKLNHFPGTFQLGRKDRLWRNFQKMISKYGLKEFGFLPHTYVLPQELKILKQTWDFKINGGKEMWIIKPPASARGVGIKVINKWSQLPKKTSLVCQKYIHNPYLINGSKFDLRLYVLVTSFHPLRIYLYPEGLARFASAKYSEDVKDLKDRYMHLTNYSINKLSSQYTANEDANSCQGHKWTLTKLIEYLHIEGVDTKVLWKNLQQLVIKTIISSEALITPLCEENMNSYYNCYELFGVDVLLDEHLKPWLLEVNISPSLHSSSPLDAYVKGPLVQTLFDLAQFHFPSRLSQNIKNAPQCFDNRLYTTALTKKERAKHSHFELFESREDYLDDILYNLTGDDIRHLLRAEDEYVVKGRFERIFPTAHTYKYMEFMEARYYNRLFDAWEAKYSSKREDGIALLQSLCAKKLHLKVAHHSTVNKNCQNMTPGETMTSNLQPSYEGHTRPLEEIMQEASISTKLLLCEEIKINNLQAV